MKDNSNKTVEVNIELQMDSIKMVYAFFILLNYLIR